MKVAFTGAHGVGKTTLSKMLEEVLEETYPESSVCKLGSATRDVLSWGGNDGAGRRISINPDDPTFQVASALKRREWMLHPFNLKMDFLISERWAIDEWVYQNAANSEWTNPARVGAASFLADEARWEIKEYWDVIYYIPVTDRPLEDDGIRPLGKEFQYKVDRFFKRELNSLSEQYKIKVVSQTLEECLEFFREEVRNWKIER